MEVIIILLSVSLLLASFFLGAFLWANKSGQFDDSQSPAVRMLIDDEVSEQTQNSNNK